MTRKERMRLMQELESIAGMKLICYVTGDRNPAVSAQIPDDAVDSFLEEVA